MPDREFLIWLHERLEYVHGENRIVDYMHKLRAIIAATPPDKLTASNLRYNSLESLVEFLNSHEESRLQDAGSIPH